MKQIVTIKLDDHQYTMLIEAIQKGAGACEVLKNQLQQRSYNAKSANWRKIFADASDRWGEDMDNTYGVGRMIRNSMRTEEVE